MRNSKPERRAQEDSPADDEVAGQGRVWHFVAIGRLGFHQGTEDLPDAASGLAAFGLMIDERAFGKFSRVEDQSGGVLRQHRVAQAQVTDHGAPFVTARFGQGLRINVLGAQLRGEFLQTVFVELHLSI